VIETAPGEVAQVDYGDGPMIRDPQSGKYRGARLFVLTLGYTSKSVRLLVFRSSSQTWAELHEKAFRRLGGVTRVVVLDNLRERKRSGAAVFSTFIRCTSPVHFRYCLRLTRLCRSISRSSNPVS
jgi:transposase